MRNDGRLLFALLFLSLVSPLVLPVHAGFAELEFEPLVIDPRDDVNATWGFTVTASGSFRLSQVSLSPVEVNRIIPYDGENLTSISITPSRHELGEISPAEVRPGRFEVSLVSVVDPGHYQVRFILSHNDQYGVFQSQTFWGSVKVSAVENPLELSMKASVSEDAESVIVFLQRSNGTAVSLALIEVCSYQRTWVFVNEGSTNSSGVADVGLRGFGRHLTIFYTLHASTCGGSVGAGPLYVGVEVFVPSEPLWPDFPWAWVVIVWALSGAAVTATAFAIESRQRKKLHLIP